ncbi:MAG TPA: GNAT family N-acetyltransferase [Verrucomicrobiae bacterium]|jgi:ribosomal protein S18 acetylase RimI-like enzyme|nr:GNAT family N-acetyltransferase [Verrucomicrobiae bacterium]
MKVVRSVLSSENKFRDFWDAALSFQNAAGMPLWSPYPADKIKGEIQAGLHYSAFLTDDVLAGYFSLALSDEVIWQEKEQGDAIYIHRMCVNPQCKGKNLAASILTWAYGFAAGVGRKFIRMDTWGDNPRLLNYYIACGFRRIGNRHIGFEPNLAPHYKNANLALFENEIALRVRVPKRSQK